jgi:hypothetical protein
LGSPAAARFADLFRRHQREVEASFERARLTVYTVGTLQATIAGHRGTWHLSGVPISAIVDLLLTESRLRVVELTANTYPPETRIVWGTPSPFELGLSLRSNSYLSHGTAAYLHGLLVDVPDAIHINKEQSPKDQAGTLTQPALDRAFSSRPRQSNLILSDENGRRFVVISGKSTNRLQVGEIRGPSRERLAVTSSNALSSTSPCARFMEVGSAECWRRTKPRENGSWRIASWQR